MSLDRNIGDSESWLYVRQFDAAGVDPTVRARARPLGGNPQMAIASRDRHPAKLYVAEENHASWSPIFKRIREYIWIHKGSPSLASAKLPDLAPGMPQTKRSL